MPHVEVAVGILGRGIGAVLQIGPETIQRAVVQAMTVGIAGGEIQPVRNSLSYSGLQAIVVRTGKIFREVNVPQKGEFAIVRTDAD